MAPNFVSLYDTTLRDGTQGKGISLTLRDKLRITRLLDDFGIPYVEGGWPGSNPKDCEYFEQVRELKLRQAKVVAFGSTRRARSTVEEDANIKALVEAQTPAVAIVGKSWTLHVTEVLRTSLDENLKMIGESVAYLKQAGREVIYDAEHFFDGMKADEDYALETLRAAARAGADTICLCDTNGGSLPNFIRDCVSKVSSTVSVRLGIHTHNDSELAVAAALAGVEAGCVQVQGTVNGYGERCGNANLISIIPALELKMGIRCLPQGKLEQLTSLARTVSEIANLELNPRAAYVGISAFSHKGGIHVAAVEKIAESYEHMAPEAVGNTRQALLSELSGRGNVRMLASNLGISVNGMEAELLEKVKDLEQKGFEFESAEGSFELFVRRSDKDYKPPFCVVDSLIVSERRREEVLTVEAVVKLRIGEEMAHTAAEGVGPVHALDRAMRKALVPHYPALEDVRLTDYKVRILDPDKATSATTRVVIEAEYDGKRWSTVGCGENILEASFQALADSIELFILRKHKVNPHIS